MSCVRERRSDVPHEPVEIRGIDTLIRSTGMDDAHAHLWTMSNAQVQLRAILL